MEYQIKYENGIANHGNLYRLKKVMDRAKAGEPLNIAFLGGSITQEVFPPNRNSVMHIMFMSGGKRHSHRQILLILMQESVERHHNLVWHVQKMTCSRRSRIL